MSTKETSAIEPQPNAWARWVNIAIGGWLVVTALFWPVTEVAFANTFIVGVLIAVASAIALWRAPVRWVDTVLAVWLFFSSFALMPVGTFGRWSNVFAAIAVFLLALVPGGGVSPSNRPGRFARDFA